MSSASFKTIFVPTLLTSSIFFYVLVSALNLVKLQSPESPPLPTNRLQYLTSKENKDLIIRNVGFCILGSVGAGLVVAEIARRQHAARKVGLLNQQPTSQISNDQQSSFATAPVNQLSNQVSSDVQDMGWVSFQAQVEDWNSFESVGTYSHVEDYEDHAEFHTGNEVNSSIASFSQSNQQGQKCRIRVPHLRQSLFAILLNGQYYSFARAEKNREKALNTVARLFDRGDRAVITQANNQYIVWIWQPNAEPDLV